jgi:Ca2+-binding RTX toxin-like protein
MWLHGSQSSKIQVRPEIRQGDDQIYAGNGADFINGGGGFDVCVDAEVTATASGWCRQADPDVDHGRPGGDAPQPATAHAAPLRVKLRVRPAIRWIIQPGGAVSS